MTESTQPTQPREAQDTVLSIEQLVSEIRTVRGVIRPVDGVSLSVKKGEAVGLVGESGSGKSMTAFSVMQLFPARAARIRSGHIKLKGEDLVGQRDRSLRRLRGREIGMVFQDPVAYLNPVITVGKQLREQLAAHKLERRAQERIAELLTLVGLSPEVASRYPHELSGGQCQRVGIASALACDPSLIIADEPTTAVDVTIQAQILKLLARLQRERGVALLLITHDLGVVAEVCDYVYIMYAGKIVEEGPVRELFQAPQHPYTQGLLAGALSVQTPTKVRATIEGSVPELVNPPSGCRFHPRCPKVMPRCRAELPPFFTAQHSRAACWLHDPETVASQSQEATPS